MSLSRPRSQGIVVALLLGTVALIVYGSLYPFDLVPHAPAQSLAQAVLELSWARAGRGDRIANVLLYAPLGFCSMLCLYGRLRRGSAVAVTVAGGILLSFSIEVTQVFIEQRVPSWWDVVLNGAGTIVGAIAGITWHELGGRMQVASSNSGRGNRSAAMVLFFWLAWRLAPFVPQFSLGKLKATFSPLADPYFSTSVTLHYWIWWTVMAHVVFSLVSAARATEALLALIAVVLASCLVLSGHVFVPSELLALMLLLPTLYVFDRLTPGPRRLILLGAIVGLFLYDSFAPFRLSQSAQSFDLWPFLAWIDAGYPLDWQWLARRACYFATMLWIFKERGLAPRSAGVLVPLAVLCVEVAQIWVVGQRPSITEPALALLIAWTMSAVETTRTTHRRHAHNR